MADSNKQNWTVTARWVFPIEQPPLERGTITIGGEKIIAVEPHACRNPDIDLGNVALLPGLVNAHTHLDLSGMRGHASPTVEFTDWLRAVVRHRRGLSVDQMESAIRTGLAESLACGTTLIGDISGQGLGWPALAAAPLRAVVFYELLGLPQLRARQAWQDAQGWLQSHPALETCRPGLSPHAPYSVRSSLFRAAARLARRHQFALAIHLAETLAEIQLLKDQRGPLVDFLIELGAWDPQGLVQGPRAILQLHADMVQVLFIHANYLNPGFPIPPSSTIIYCPRTHAAFGHETHPFRELVAAGVRVALGTDSLASNPDLSVLAEARFLHQQYPQVPGANLLHMATLAGAEALGWQKETGSLTPGKSADVIVLPLPSDDPQDPHELVLRSSLPVRAVLWQGRWTFGNC